MSMRRRASLRFVVLAGAAALVAGGQGVTASAAAAVFAAGEMQATVQITPPGIPPATATQCAPDTFTFSGGGQVASVLIGAVGTYVGPITFSGSGSSPCTDVLRDTFAPITVTVGPNSNFSGGVSCPLLTGSLVRITSVVEITVAGTCTLNGDPYNSVFISTGAFVPGCDQTTISGVVLPDCEQGVTRPVTSGTYTGAFTLAA